MEYVKEIKGLDSVADLYQGPESRYNDELGFVFACVTPRAREVFPVCLKSSPAIGLIFIPMVYYKVFIRLCDEEELVVLPEC